MSNIKYWLMYSIISIGAITLTSCGGGGGSTSNNNATTNTTLSGIAQKGPFNLGSVVTAHQLNSNGTRNGNTVQTTTDNLGKFKFDVIPWSGATEFEVSGAYFNEVTALTSTIAGMSIIENIDSTTTQVNINVFTHFEAQRIQKLMSAGTNFTNAKAVARANVKQAFSLTLANGIDLQELDFTQQTTNNADNLELLKISSAIAAKNSLFNDLNSAITNDGSIEDNLDIMQDVKDNIPGSLTAVITNLKSLDTSITPLMTLLLPITIYLF